MPRLYPYLLLILPVFSAIDAACQQYPFDHFGSREGLANDVINNIFQDERGFIYISTNAGLTFYDGSVFRSAQLPVPEGDQLIRKCKRLNNGKVWVNYAGNKQLTWVDKEIASLAPLQSRVIINNVIENLAAQTLVCADQGLFAWQADSLQRVNCGMSGNDRMLHNIIPVGDQLLLAVRKGLPAALLDRSSLKKIDESPMDISLNDCVRDSRGDLWMGSENHGLLIMDGEALKQSRIVFKKLPNLLSFLAKEDIFCLANDENGNLLIGTNHYGLLNWHLSGELQVFNNNNGLSSNTVKCILVDQDNNWWVGTNNGIDRLNNKSFQSYNKVFGLPPGMIYYTERDTRNRIWFFGASKMHYLNGQVPASLDYPEGVEKITLHTSVSSNGLWVAVPNHLFFINTTGQRPFISTLIRTKDSYRRLLALDNDKVLLAGKKTLALLNHNKITVVTDTIVDIRALLKDRFNRVWVGTFENAIYRLRYDSIHNNFRPLQRVFYKTRSIARINTFFEDLRGNIWAGTRFDGVVIFDVDSVGARYKASLTSENGLNNNYVTHISASSPHFVWIAGHTGFDRVNISNESYAVENTSGFYSFNNPVSRLLMDGSGMWASSDIGAFYVSLYPQKKSSAPVYLKELIFPDHRYPLYTTDTSIRLGASQHSFTISFTTPFYTNEKQTRYFYRLLKNKMADKWVEVSGNHSINFNSLQPGKYRLEIRAVMFNGQQASKPAALNIILATPFFRSAWFILLIVLLALLLGYAVYRYRIRQIKNLVSVRDTISRNLHDEIGATLSSINIYSDVARKKNRDEDTGKLLERIYKGSGQAMSSINDIVWLVNPANDSLENIALRMREFCIPLLEAREINIDFEVSEKIMAEKMTMLQRQHIYYIFKEAVNNILKYAGATKVTIELKREGRALLMTIADNGSGFDLRDLKPGNGIRHMRERAKEIQGTLTINSAPGNGCQILLRADIA